MPRANLRGLIGNLGDTEPPADDVDPQPVEATGSVAEDPPAAVEGTVPKTVRRSSDRPVQHAETNDPEQLAVVRFSDLQRKETRLRADQQNALTELARRLNRAKGVGGQRITDNTLIRVAIDLLLSKAGTLAGQDEDALRRSIGIKARER